MISASKCKRKTSTDPDVLYFATSNAIQMYVKLILKINFHSSVDYTWDFITTDLNILIIRLDFLNFYKLTVDTNKRC